MKIFKRIFVLLVALFAGFILISCGNVKPEVEVTYTAFRDKIVLKVTVDDAEDVLADSVVTLKIEKTDKENPYSTTKTVDSTKEDTQTVTFSNLESLTEYKVTAYGTYDKKQHTFYEEKISTIDQGGSVEKPLEINNYDEFLMIADDPSGCFKLMADIDLEGKTLNALFSATKVFTGDFNGNGKTISNYKYGYAEETTTTTDAEGNETPETKEVEKSHATTYLGIFGYIGAGAKIYDLTISNAKVYDRYTSNEAFAGILAGLNQGTVTNVNVTNSSLKVESVASGTTALNAGLLIGKNNGVVDGCSADGSLEAKAANVLYAGGLVGNNFKDSTINSVDCKIVASNANATIKATLEGTSTSVSKVKLAVGEITGATSAYAILDDCYGEGTMDLTTSSISTQKTLTYYVFAGGIVGENNSNVSNSLSKVTINFNTLDADAKYANDTDYCYNKIMKVCLGGVVGYNCGSSLVNDCGAYNPTINATRVNTIPSDLNEDGTIDDDEILPFTALLENATVSSSTTIGSNDGVEGTNILVGTWTFVGGTDTSTVTSATEIANIENTKLSAKIK